MLPVSYGLFLLLILWASARRGSDWAPRAEGSPWRLVAIVVSLACLALFLSLLPQQHGTSTLLVTAALAGPAAYGIGAAAWVGAVAYRLRVVGWILLAVVFGVPSTLSLALPVVGLLAFTLVPISRYGHAEATARGASA